MEHRDGRGKSGSKSGRKGPEWHFVDDEPNNASAVSCSRGLNLRLLVLFFFLAVFVGYFYYEEMRVMAKAHMPTTWFNEKPTWQSEGALKERLSGDGGDVPEPTLPAVAGDGEAAEVGAPDAPGEAEAEGDGAGEAEGGAAAPATEEGAGAAAGASEAPIAAAGSPVWPPPQCTGALPASRPKVAGGGRRLRRSLLSEAPTKLLVDKDPPDAALKSAVYDYLRDFMASEKPCTPRSLAGTRQTCSGMGGGLSCRGKKLPACEPAPPGEGGRPPLFPKPGNFRGPESFQPGAWGRCAFIATGENVLKADWGEHIDAHDTVIRYNTPIKGYERHVGTKTSLMFTKDKYSTTAKPSMGFIVGGKEKPKGPAYTLRRQEMLVLRDQAHRLWFTARGIKEGKAAAGLTRAITLVKSGLCTHIDLYGFSTAAKGRGGKYFAKKAIVTPGHTIDWDGWLLKALMDLGYLCVYGE